MELESHVVVCDSRYYYSAGDGDWNRQYYFDWSVIPDGKYEITFSLVSDPVSNLNDQYSVFSNVISPQNVYQASGNIGAITRAFIGNLHYATYNTPAVTANLLFADQHTNPPVICNRPMTNIFTIGIFDGMSGTSNLTMPPYILTLHFKPLRLGLA
jgi:hypothetical protein